MFQRFFFKSPFYQNKIKICFWSSLISRIKQIFKYISTLTHTDPIKFLKERILEYLGQELQLASSKSVTFPFPTLSFFAPSTSVVFHTISPLINTTLIYVPFSSTIQIPIIVVTSTLLQVVMATIYAPFALLGQLHDLPQNYTQRLIQYDG